MINNSQTLHIWLQVIPDFQLLDNILGIHVSKYLDGVRAFPTCRLLRWVRCHETTVGHRWISAENNGHGIAGGAHLRACWYCTTESLQARGSDCQSIHNLECTGVMWSNKGSVPASTSRSHHHLLCVCIYTYILLWFIIINKYNFVI